MKKFLKKYQRTTVIVGIVIIALFFYFAGYLVGHQNLVFEKNYKPVIASKELLKPKSVDFSIFWDAWDKISQSYVGTPDYQKMVYGAISGMTDSLGDPYSYFLSSNDAKNFSQELSGEVSGIGAQIDSKDGKILIVAPIAGSPAEKAGLKPKDQVTKIDGMSTTNMSLNDAVSKIRGDAGTTVTLGIIHEGQVAEQTYKITRDTIKIDSVNWKMEPGNIAYIQITQFGDDTTTLMQQAAKDIDAKKPKSIILDLRSNPGGYLQSAVDIASLWNNNQVVVQEKYKDGHVDQDKTTSTDPILGKYKTIILVNGGSASASEILAGALQDWKKGTLVGDKTFGKGSVQALDNLNGGAELRLTIAKWLTPKGRTIDGTGLEPDVKVGLTEADSNVGKDPQLEKALQLAQ